MKGLKLVVGITAEPSVELLHGQLSYMKSKGYDVFLLAPSHERVFEFCRKEGVQHIPITIKRTISIFSDFLTLFHLILIFKKHKPDIVNLGTPKISLLGMLAAFITGVKLRIYTCRGFVFEHQKGPIYYLLIFFEKIITLCSHKVICISKSVADLGIEKGIFPQRKISLIAKGSSNGLDMSLFNPDSITPETILQLKHEYDLLDKFTFVYVGRLVDRKGIYELFNAFTSVYTRDETVRLLMIGRPFWDQIKDKKLIEDYHLHPGIVMLGFQPFEKVPHYLLLGNVFVLPAWWEGFGNVLIQAAAVGLPILSTDVTGCKDAVSDGYNGKLIAAKNIQLLEEAMIWFKDNPEECIRMGKNGIEWSKNFIPEIIWSGLSDLYKKEYQIRFRN